MKGKVVPLVVLLAAIVAAAGGASLAPAAPPEYEQTTAIGLETRFRIGCADCGDTRQLTPTSLAFLDDGALAVLDSYEPFVRVFDAVGEPVVAFGRAGPGPAEMGVDGGSRWIPALWLFGMPGGGVAVLDPLRPLLKVFDADGAHVGQQPLNLAIRVPNAQAFDPETRTYFRLGFAPVTGSRMISRCLLDAPGGPECDDFLEPDAFLRDEMEPGAGAAPPRLELGASPRGELLIADPAGYRIWMLDGNVEVVLRAGRSVSGTEKTAAELAGEEEMNQRLVAAGRRPRPIDPLRTPLAQAGVQVDGVERIWVLTQRHTGDNTIFDVFGGDGAYLTEVTVDAVIRRGSWHVGNTFIIAGRRLAAITQQPDGSEAVQVWEIIDAAR
jgi:hypothetical protein